MKTTLFSMLILLAFSCQQNHPLQKEYPQSIEITLTNPSALIRTDALVDMPLPLIQDKYTDFNPHAFVVINNGEEVASQIVDMDADGTPDKLQFLCDLQADEVKNVNILYAVDGKKNREYTKRTQAEISHKTGGEWVKREYIGGSFQNTDYLSVPPEHTDHSWFIRYEGPGWESDKVGYRLYLDWRNAVDIFGKKTTEMVLQNVGGDGFDSYHEMNDWGMDILKVGGSLGIGSIAMWISDSARRIEKTDSLSCRIVANGVIQSIVKTNYSGWQINDQKYNLTSLLTINAGSRLTRCDLIMDKNPDNLCTGIVKHDSAVVITSGEIAGEWQYVATYGRQSLNNDNLGMAVLYKKSDMNQLAEDKHSYVVVLKPTNGSLSYYYLAAWQAEPDGVLNKEEFIKYLEDTVAELNNPISMSAN